MSDDLFVRFVTDKNYFCKNRFVIFLTGFLHDILIARRVRVDACAPGDFALSCRNYVLRLENMASRPTMQPPR
jgi:hypothetical protein